MLLDMPAPLQAESPAPTGESDAAAWNGYGGVGEYARSTGNTFEVRETAHLIPDNKIDALLASAIDSSESFDIVVAGGGFSGLGAPAREFVRASCKAPAWSLKITCSLGGRRSATNSWLTAIA